MRWRESAPAGFTFAVKMPARALRSLGTFEERARLLGDRLGSCASCSSSRATTGMLALLLGSLDPALRLALDLRHPTWDDVDVAPRGARRRLGRGRPLPLPPLPRAAVRRRPSWTSSPRAIRPLLAAGVDVFAYFRHEDEPRAPAAARRVLDLLA